MGYTPKCWCFELIDQWNIKKSTKLFLSLRQIKILGNCFARNNLLHFVISLCILVETRFHHNISWFIYAIQISIRINNAQERRQFAVKLLNQIFSWVFTINMINKIEYFDNRTLLLFCVKTISVKSYIVNFYINKIQYFVYISKQPMISYNEVTYDLKM